MLRQAWLTIMASCLLSSSAHADLVLSEPTLELGKVRAGHVAEHRVGIVNTGTAVAEVTEIKSGCACLKADVEPHKIAPGKRGELVVRVNTLSATAGSHAWRVVVRSRAGGVDSDAALIVRAEVYQEIVVQPPSIIIYSDSATRHEIAVTDLRTKPLRILKLEPSSPHLQAMVVGEERSPDGCLVRKIKLDVGAGFPPGKHDETLTIHTDDPLYRRLQVTISLMKKPRQRFSALPPSVTLTASEQQSAPTRLITIRDSQGKPVEIEGVAADDPAIAVQWSPGAQPVGTIKLTVDRAKMLGESLTSRVVVQFKDADGAKLSIPVRCDTR